MTNTTKTHNIFMIVGTVIVVAIGALQALHTAIPGASWIDTVVGILLFTEHLLAGNTTETPSVIAPTDTTAPTV